MSPDQRARNLKAMLSEAKDTSELMVDLAYASLYFADERMAGEVDRLEERLSDLIHEMREVSVLAARSPHDAEAMSGVLHVISAIERNGNAAVDISRIVTRHLGIPAALVADLAAADEVAHRVRVREGSHLAQRALADVELPTEIGMRVVAVRRARSWIIDPDGDDLVLADDVLIVRGRREGIDEVRRLAGAPDWRPPPVEESTALTDLDRAVDVLVEMKNTSEVAVGLAYSALIFDDEGLAAEVVGLEQRLDEMREQLELWVLRAAASVEDPSVLRGLLHLAAAAATIGDSAQQIVWLVEHDEEMHPILRVALGAADEVIVRVPVARGSELDGAGSERLHSIAGFSLLAIGREGRVFRPRGQVRLQAGDELTTVGPWEGRDDLAAAAGYALHTDDDTGLVEVVPPPAS